MTTEILPLPYNADPLPGYAERLSRPYAFALTGGRYTLIGWDPVEVITAASPDPFAYMQARMESFKSAVSPCGGWYGYLGYELAEILYPRLAPRPRDLPFPDLCMGLYDRVHVFDHEKQAAYEAKHGLDTSPSLRGYAYPRNDAGSGTRNDGKFTTNLPPDRYQAAFNQAQAALRRGDCYQVNLAQRFTAEFKGSAWAYFLALLKENPAPFAAYLHLPEGEIISCSPERFLRIEEGQIQTKPIKGTCPRAEDPEQDRQAAEDLRLSEKNRAENLMIVDLMRNDLGKICVPGSIQVPALFEIESYRSVHHLVSQVVGTLEPRISPLEALKHCFPGGSITGAPKLAAMEQIRALEPDARHVYCGSIGYCDFSGTLDMNIAIRTAAIAQGQCTLWAGGGIVLDSVWDDEYQECMDKIAPFLRVACQENE
jgi:para-aminobenzoate synthetase component 1